MTDQKTGVFGQRARGRRTQLGLNLRQVGDTTGIAISQLSKIERGGGGTTLDAAMRIASALSIPLAYLTGEQPCMCCQGSPPVGMTCQECGTDGPVFAEILEASHG